MGQPRPAGFNNNNFGNQPMPRNFPQQIAPAPGPVMMMNTNPLNTNQVNPNQLRPNLPPFVLEYNAKGPILLQAVIPTNPNYKSQVGEFIYEFVERETGEDMAPKITGMLIDLPINDIREYLVDYGKIVQKMSEARALLTTPQ